jgi:hypothetical protein
VPALGNLHSCASPLESTSFVVDSLRRLSTIVDDRTPSFSSRTRRFAVTHSPDSVTRSHFLSSPAYARGTYRISATALPFQMNKVLQGQWGSVLASPLYCTNSEVALQTSLAVKGDALIHGARLVAPPVGSEWRTRRPSYRTHPTNYKGDHQ